MNKPLPKNRKKYFIEIRGPVYINRIKPSVPEFYYRFPQTDLVDSVCKVYIIRFYDQLVANMCRLHKFE